MNSAELSSEVPRRGEKKLFVLGDGRNPIEATELDVRATQIGESIWGEGYNNGLAVSRLEWKQKIQKYINHLKDFQKMYNTMEIRPIILDLEKLIGDKDG